MFSRRQSKSTVLFSKSETRTGPNDKQLIDDEAMKFEGFLQQAASSGGGFLGFCFVNEKDGSRTIHILGAGFTTNAAAKAICILFEQNPDILRAFTKIISQR